MGSLLLLLLLVVSFSSLMSTHLVSAKTILDAENAVQSDIPSILGTLYKKRELNNLLLTCFDGSHQYSTQGAYQRLQGISSDVHQDAAADFHLPPCLDNFLYGEKDDSCNHMQNNSWYAILKDEFADVALHELQQENGNDKIFLKKICSSWMRLLELQGLTDESKGFGNHAETTALVIDEFIRKGSTGLEASQDITRTDGQKEKEEETTLDISKRSVAYWNGGVARNSGNEIFNAMALFASIAALGLAFYAAKVSSFSTSGNSTGIFNNGSVVNGSPVTITADSPNVGTVNIST